MVKGVVSDDLEYDNVPMGKVFGPDGMKTILAGMITGVAEVEWIVHRQTAGGGTVMNERTDRFRIGDQWIELPVAGVFEVGDDGRLRLWRDYFDVPTFTNQREAITPAEIVVFP